MFVFKAAVVGAGTMGGEIAQVVAAADVPVVLKDIEPELVDAGIEKARQVTEGQMAGLVKKEKLTQEQADQRTEEIVGRIKGATEYEGFGDVDFVIEAVPEKMEVKQAVFAELDDLVPGHAILASNTSALSISEIGGATSRPDQVVGFHFFYPASVMRLIEVVEGEDTSEETAQAAANFAMQIRKTPVRCGEEPGFVVNRVLNSAASEIWRHQDETGLEPEQIDKEIAEAKVTPMGPFFLSDLLGLDTVLHVAEHLHEAYGERFYVHPRMKELVEAGNLGQKTGRGYYDHGGDSGGDGDGDGE
jgi:3-hydroxyacyl-CoA dehydrogenase